MKKLSIILILLCLCICRIQAQAGFGRSLLMNDNWLFSLSDDSRYSSAEYDDKGWRVLTLPHDWSIEGTPSKDFASCTGYLPGGIGWYRKHFKVEDSEALHYIYFEGVYNRSEVYLNGHLLGKRPNGYVSFMYDMSKYLNKGENVLAVRVDHSRNADSRWYTGSGIYRNVWMVSSGNEHFAQWGVWAASDDKVDGKLNIFCETEGDSTNLEKHAMLFDANNNIVGEARSKDDKFSITVNGKVNKWSTDSPYLYRLRVELTKNGKVIDQSESRTGFRTLSFDADKGFALNGKTMKVKGVCLHHDAGVLGSVVPKDVWRRRLTALKNMGANAIRMSHNPQAPDLYDLCDEMGFLVMDEGSDEWEFPKRKWLKGWNKGEPGYDGTFDFFEEWIERDVTDMVKRDRVHPCVFLWSVGNEVDYPNDPYSHPVLDGKNSKINQPMFGGYKKDAPRAERIGQIAKRLAACIRKADSTRPVTGALAGVVMSNETEYPEAVDVVGYNYTENRYEEDHKTYPKRIIYGSETSTNLAAWKAVRDNDYIFGQFVWTGLDYLGESGAWPSRGLGTGLIDFAGFLKGRGWFFKSLWSEKPVAYIGTYPNRNRDSNKDKMRYSIDALDLWNYREGQQVEVVCYTNAKKARLILNGKEIGQMKDYDEEHGMIGWIINYAPGTLTVECFDKNNNNICSYSITTDKKVESLRRTDIGTTQESAVKQMLVEAIDINGNRVKNARQQITAKVKPQSTRTHILGIENGSNQDMTIPKALTKNLHNGRAVIYYTGNSEDIDCTIIQDN